MKYTGADQRADKAFLVGAAFGRDSVLAEFEALAGDAKIVNADSLRDLIAKLREGR